MMNPRAVPPQAHTGCCIFFSHGIFAAEFLSAGVKEIFGLVQFFCILFFFCGGFWDLVKLSGSIDGAWDFCWGSELMEVTSI